MHTKTKGNEFPSLLSLITLLARPHSHYSPPSLGVSATPTLSSHSKRAHNKWGRTEGGCKCSGKYIDIYFILKITYPISTLPEHLHSTIPNINRIEGCAKIQTNRGITGNVDTTNTNAPKGPMPRPCPWRSVVKPSGQVS